MTTTNVRPQLDFATDFVYLLHGDVDFSQGLAETRPPARQTNTENIMDEMEYETLQIHTLLQYFVTNIYGTDLLGVNSKDLSDSFCLITSGFFFTTMSRSSLI